MDWDNTTKQEKRKDAFYIFAESVLNSTMSCAKMLMSRSVITNC